MKAELKFEFDTENPDHERELKVMQQGKLFKLALWDIDQELRKKIKYEELPENVHEALQGIRDFLWETLREYEVNLDD